MTTTHLPNGVTNTASISPLGQMKCLDPTQVLTYHEDFILPSDISAAAPASYTTTLIGSGTTTYSTTLPGGVLAFATDVNDNDQTSIQRKGSFFLHNASKSWGIKTRFKLSEVLLSEMIIGLAIQDTTPLDATTRIVFQKDVSTAAIVARMVTGGVTTNLGSATLVADTFVELGLKYDAVKGKISFLTNGVITASTTTATSLSTTVLISPVYSVKAREAAAKTLSVDFLTVMQDATIPGSLVR